MGFSPGDFYNLKEAGGASFHWEGKDTHIALWNTDESELILALDIDEAEEALSQLELLVGILRAKAL